MSKNLAIMIKPASSLCNMRCKYCFYADVSDMREVKSHGIMTEETIDILVKKIFEHLDSGDHCTIAFQGGEPTLAGVSYFSYFSQKVDEHLKEKKISISYALQTNGLDISEEFLQYLKEYNFLVGLSIDLNKDYHDLNRVDSTGKGTFSRILKTKKAFEKYEIPHNILCVLTEPLAKHPEKVWNFITKNQFGFVQFIPCLGDLNQNNSSLSLTSKSFSTFYGTLVPFWYRSLKENQYVSIRFFDDLFHLILDKQVNSCGFTGNCGIQLVVESNGSVFPCDFYVLDQWKLGDFYNNTIEEMQKSRIGEEFLSRRSTLPTICSNCDFINMCRGGCERMSVEMYATENYCGYQDFLKNNKVMIDEIANYIQKIK